MKYVEGYSCDDIECCPFCGSTATIHHINTGEHKCLDCGKTFVVIETEDA